jgi:hypothetical protein
MFNKILFALAICFAGLLSNAQAQTYLDAGKTYSFTALNADGTKAVTLAVVFDKEGVATISRKEASPTDKNRTAFHFLTKETVKIVDNDEKQSIVSVESQNLTTYITVSFDGEILARQTGAAATTIGCNCVSKFGDGSCDLSYMGSGPSRGCLECISNGDKPCARCEVVRIVSTGGKFTSGSVLLIQAKEVRFAK